MNKMKLISLILIATLSQSLCNEPGKAHFLSAPKFIKAAVFYSLGLWLLGETLLDCGHRYLQYKTVIQEYRWELLKDSQGRLTNTEINSCSIMQGISAIPRIFWREFAAGALSLYLLYSGTKSLMEPDANCHETVNDN